MSFYNDVRFLCHDLLVFSEFRNRCGVLSEFVLQTNVNELWPSRLDIYICNQKCILILLLLAVSLRKLGVQREVTLPCRKDI